MPGGFQCRHPGRRPSRPPHAGTPMSACPFADTTRFASTRSVDSRSSVPGSPPLRCSRSSHSTSKWGTAQPHFDSPQLRQVMHPSMRCDRPRLAFHAQLRAIRETASRRLTAGTRVVRNPSARLLESGCVGQGRSVRLQSVQLEPHVVLRWHRRSRRPAKACSVPPS